MIIAHNKTQQESNNLTMSSCLSTQAESTNDLEVGRLDATNRIESDQSVTNDDCGAMIPTGTADRTKLFMRIIQFAVFAEALSKKCLGPNQALMVLEGGAEVSL